MDKGEKRKEKKKEKEDTLSYISLGKEKKRGKSIPFSLSPFYSVSEGKCGVEAESSTTRFFNPDSNSRLESCPHSPLCKEF